MVKLYKFETKAAALSPARQRLKDLLDKRAACEERAASLRIAEQRLVETSNEAVRTNQAVADFDAEFAAAVLAWSKNSLDKGETPQVDATRRQELLIAKAIAAENAMAANAARNQLQADIQAEMRASKNLQPEVEHLVAEIIVESTEELISELQEAQRDVARRKHRLDQALRTVIDIAHATGSKATFNLMESLCERFRTAGAPTFEASMADRAAWEAFAARLRTYAGAELEG
ncbi:hypothetical protein [Nitrobacter sp. JJSN]|uniref:hypothetical protein n=1 Tax=Nitrobacter sp. JJSN TaxID=3453033 RepID=UPI003F75A852